MKSRDNVKLNEYSKKFYKKNRKEIIKSQQVRNATPNGKYIRYRFSAKRRGIDFKLTLKEFISLVSQSCSYCGSNNSIGVDRVDNQIGYLLENSKPCCTTCNMMKKALPVEIFVEHCQKITSFNT